MNFHCHRVHLDPAYIGQFWLTYHMNVEFDFETEKWMYPTGETRFQYQQGYLTLIGKSWKTHPEIFLAFF